MSAIEKQIEAKKVGISLTPEEQFEIFGTEELGEYEPRAEERWGETEAWQQSQLRTGSYTKSDWMEINSGAAANTASFAKALRGGEPTDGAVAGELAETHRQHISRWYYDCGYETHRGLAEMYFSEERFAAHYEKVEAGLARFVHDAIVANADRLGK